MVYNATHAGTSQDASRSRADWVLVEFTNYKWQRKYMHLNVQRIKAQIKLFSNSFKYYRYITYIDR